jgi:hypothetical protein
VSRYALFDLAQVKLGDVAQRGHEITAADCLPLAPPERPYPEPRLDRLVERITAARQNGRPVIVMMGAHPIKLGLSRYLVDLVERRIITHLGTNGAAIIHDFELAAFGGTSESVAKWIRGGQFGLWHQTSRLNELVAQAAASGEGMSEEGGRVIEE